MPPNDVPQSFDATATEPPGGLETIRRSPAFRYAAVAICGIGLAAAGSTFLRLSQGRQQPPAPAAETRSEAAPKVAQAPAPSASLPEIPGATSPAPNSARPAGEPDRPEAAANTALSGGPGAPERHAAVPGKPESYRAEASQPPNPGANTASPDLGKTPVPTAALPDPPTPETSSAEASREAAASLPDASTTVAGPVPVDPGVDTTVLPVPAATANSPEPASGEAVSPSSQGGGRAGSTRATREMPAAQLRARLRRLARQAGPQIAKGPAPPQPEPRTRLGVPKPEPARRTAQAPQPEEAQSARRRENTRPSAPRQTRHARPAETGPSNRSEAMQAAPGQFRTMPAPAGSAPNVRAYSFAANGGRITGAYGAPVRIIQVR